MASQLQSRLARLEAAMTPEAREFVTYCTCVIHGDGSKCLPIPEEEMDRVRAEGYRDGVDALIVIKQFVDGPDLEDA